MVIIPRVLASLVRELDDGNAGRLALTFAERAIEVCGGALSGAERDASLSYLAAARNFVDGDGTVSDLGEAHNAYFAVRNQHSRLSDDVTWIAAISVAVCCQRQMEEAGIVRKNKYKPGLLNVAKAAQAVAGQYHDPETSLHYNQHRYYDPATGAYLTSDLLGLTPAPNPHTYVPNPTVLTDPLGLAPDSYEDDTYAGSGAGPADKPIRVAGPWTRQDAVRGAAGPTPQRPG